MLAVASPAAHFLASSHSQIAPLARGFALFAPGLAGYGMVACLSRVLLADRRTRAAVIPVGGGWLIVIAADVVLVALAPGPWVVGMLALGNTIGLTAAGLALAVAVRRTRGMAALAGSCRVAVSGLIAALAGAAAGGGAAAALRPSGPVADALTAVLAALLAAAVFAAVAYVLDKAEVRAVAARIRAGALR